MACLERLQRTLSRAEAARPRMGGPIPNSHNLQKYLEGQRYVYRRAMTRERCWCGEGSQVRNRPVGEDSERFVGVVVKSLACVFCFRALLRSARPA